MMKRMMIFMIVSSYDEKDDDLYDILFDEYMIKISFFLTSVCGSGILIKINAINTKNVFDAYTREYC